MANLATSAVQAAPLDTESEAVADKIGLALVLSELNPRDSVFITAYLLGMDAQSAAVESGRPGKLAGAKILGRPTVRRAILAAAPFLQPKAAARALAPYAVERMARTLDQGNDAQALSAARDVLAMAGYGPVQRSETIRANLGDVLDALDRRRGNEPPTVDLPTPRKT